MDWDARILCRTLWWKNDAFGVKALGEEEMHFSNVMELYEWRAITEDQS